MRYGSIPGIDKKISRLAQGTAMMGDPNAEWAFSLLDQVFEMGCTMFDTAHVYGGGANERTVGAWVRDRGIRDQIVMIAKGAHLNADRHRVTPLDIASDLHDSLDRFKFDRIDLYILHRDDPSVPVEPIVDALNEHVQAGRIRAFGGSNWSHQRLQEANEYARKNGLVPFVASSPHFSLAVQIEEPWTGCISITGEGRQAARDWYSRDDMALIPWSSLSAGFFSGRFTYENKDTFKEGMDSLCMRCYANEGNFKRFDRASELGKKKGATAAQIALAWVLNQPLNVFPLVGSLSGDEFKQNVEALDIKLTDQELAWLDLRD